MAQYKLEWIRYNVEEDDIHAFIVEHLLVNRPKTNLTKDSHFVRKSTSF